VEELARERFAELARRPEPEIDLAEGALWIAAEAYPGLDVAAYLAKLDELAAALHPVVGEGALRERVLRLNRGLFREHRFAGNRRDYYDPRNSFLNEVLDRRLGIPLTLALVFVEVAQRLGIPAVGVCFPGHFLAKVPGAEEIVVDAFAGTLLAEADCRTRFQRVMGADATFGPDALRAARPREILARMLGNLKRIYLERRDFLLALGCCDRLLLLDPDAPAELRDRGLLYQRLECFAAAVADLERFLQLAPGHSAAPGVRRVLRPLREQARRVH
jgi:regulator of sirC expression with transglutaminase-like and TPR domain